MMRSRAKKHLKVLARFVRTSNLFDIKRLVVERDNFF